MMDGVERSRSRAPHAATEMNFGLHFAGSGRLARRGRPGQKVNASENCYIRFSLCKRHSGGSSPSLLIRLAQVNLEGDIDLRVQ